MKPKVAVLGASGIGKYHVREFINAGCTVTSILGSSKESAEKTAQMLFDTYGIRVQAYDDLHRLLEEEDIDIISICTPSHLHPKQVRTCLEYGLHVMCEKPLIEDNYNEAARLFVLAEEKNVLLCVNTQWACLSDFIKSGHVETLHIRMDPGKQGRAMLVDHIPHANNILIGFVPHGKAKNIRFLEKSNGINIICFDYEALTQICKVQYEFHYKEERPRSIELTINGRKYTRKIGENYQQSFFSEGERIMIEDPFKISIGKFVQAVQGKGQPLLPADELLENIRLQQDIMQNY